MRLCVCVCVNTSVCVYRAPVSYDSGAGYPEGLRAQEFASTQRSHTHPSLESVTVETTHSAATPSVATPSVATPTPSNTQRSDTEATLTKSLHSHPVHITLNNIY